MENSNSEFSDPRKKRLHELKMKINEAKRLNNEAVQTEALEETDKSFKKRLRKREWIENEKKLEDRIGGKEKKYLHETIGKCEGMKVKAKVDPFGWDMFNENALYRAYYKRVDKMPKVKDAEDEKEGVLVGGKTKKKRLYEERVDLLVKDI